MKSLRVPSEKKSAAGDEEAFEGAVRAGSLDLPSSSTDILGLAFPNEGGRKENDVGTSDSGTSCSMGRCDPESPISALPSALLPLS
jgi:hypothetical protein